MACLMHRAVFFADQSAPTGVSFRCPVDFEAEYPLQAPLDLSEALCYQGPATGPGLCTNFIRLNAGDSLTLAPNATSQVLYVIAGPEGCYTLVGTELDANGQIRNPTRVNWTPSLAFMTPPGYWHAHYTLPQRRTAPRERGLTESVMDSAQNVQVDALGRSQFTAMPLTSLEQPPPPLQEE